MDNTIIILLKTLLFFGSVYVYIILLKCGSTYGKYCHNPDSVSLFVTERQKDHLLNALLIMVFSILIGVFAVELIRGSDMISAFLIGLFFSLAFCTVNPFALMFYGFFFFLFHQQKKLLAGKLPPPLRASEMRFARYSKDSKIAAFVLLGSCVLFAALPLFFTVKEDDFRYLLYLGLLSVAGFIFLTWAMLFQSDGGSLFDTIFINAEGIKRESCQGKDIFIPWDYIYEIRKYFGYSRYGRGPAFMSVKSITGEEITWCVSNRLEPEQLMLELHPELKLIIERAPW